MPQRGEPAFNAPWPAFAVPLLLAGAYAAQAMLLSNGAIVALALSPLDVAQGRLAGLVTYIFLHAGIGHLVMNAFAAFAFGPPIARYFGADGKGAAAFFIFFLVCGVIAGLGYVAAHWGDTSIAVGASGAVSALWGGASRLLVGRGMLAPLFHRRVLTQALAFTLVNVAIGLLGVMGGLFIAWEAHLAGYAAGLILIGPFGRAVGWR